MPITSDAVPLIGNTVQYSTVQYSTATPCHSSVTRDTTTHSATILQHLMATTLLITLMYTVHNAILISLMQAMKVCFSNVPLPDPDI